MLTTVDVEQARVIQFSHGKVNAMDLEFCQGLTNELKDAESDMVPSLLLEGNGRVFSAGVDLKRLVEEPSGYLDDFLDSLEQLFEKLFVFPRPLIAHVNGHAVAGGCVMACSADARLAHDRARIGVPELRVGVPFPSLGLEIMRFTASPSHFRQMINVGATFSGDRALQAGLFDEIVDAERGRERALEIASEMIRVPSKVFTLTKQQLRRPAMEQVRASESAFRSQIHELWRSDEIQSAVREYVDQTL